MASSMSDIFTKNNLIAAVVQGGVAYLAVRFLVPSEAVTPYLSQHAITVALTLGVVSILVDQVLPRVDGFLASYQL